MTADVTQAPTDRKSRTRVKVLLDAVRVVALIAWIAALVLNGGSRLLTDPFLFALPALWSTLTSGEGLLAAAGLGVVSWARLSYSDGPDGRMLLLVGWNVLALALPQRLVPDDIVAYSLLLLFVIVVNLSLAITLAAVPRTWARAAGGVAIVAVLGLGGVFAFLLVQQPGLLAESLGRQASREFQQPHDVMSTLGVVSESAGVSSITQAPSEATRSCRRGDELCSVVLGESSASSIKADLRLVEAEWRVNLLDGAHVEGARLPDVAIIVVEQDRRVAVTAVEADALEAAGERGFVRFP